MRLAAGWRSTALGVALARPRRSHRTAVAHGPSGFPDRPSAGKAASRSWPMISSCPTEHLGIWASPGGRATIP